MVSIDLTRADLTGANLVDANLTGADLTGAHFTSTDPTVVYISDTDFTNANLDGARWAADTAAPPGWQRDSDKPGRLKRADPSSGGAPTDPAPAT